MLRQQRIDLVPRFYTKYICLRCLVLASVHWDFRKIDLLWLLCSWMVPTWSPSRSQIEVWCTDDNIVHAWWGHLFLVESHYLRQLVPASFPLPLFSSWLRSLSVAVMVIDLDEVQKTWLGTHPPKRHLNPFIIEPTVPLTAEEDM